MRNEILTITLTRTDAGLWLAFVVTTALSALYVWSLWHRRAAPRHRSSAEEILQKWQGTAYLIVGLFFLAALLAAGFVLFDTIRNVIVVSDGKASSPNLGAGALIAAILGAPFVIWGTVLKYQTLRYTKEGHITDRISKAVEQLGAEKSVERIGRAVTIFTGEPERVSYSAEDAIKFADKPRTKISLKEWGEAWDEFGIDVEEGYRQIVSTWPEERTVIQWQGKKIDLKKHEVVGKEGDWEVFKETARNIEVRIGGLLSLERISQDSVKYDKGRDHVRVMEILCAYVRNNAPASSAAKPPGKDPAELPDDATAKQISKTVAAWRDRAKVLRDWAKALPKPREDIQLALSIIARRDARQRQIEARWGANAAPDAEWVFDAPFDSVAQRA